MDDEQNCLDSLVTKHFNKAGDESQALVANGHHSVHLLSFIGNEESTVTFVTPLLVVLHEEVATHACDQRHKTLLHQALHVESQHK